MKTPKQYLAAAPTPEAALLLALEDARKEKYAILLAQAIRNSTAPQPPA